MIVTYVILADTKIKSYILVMNLLKMIMIHLTLNVQGYLKVIMLLDLQIVTVYQKLLVMSISLIHQFVTRF